MTSGNIGGQHLKVLTIQRSLSDLVGKENLKSVSTHDFKKRSVRILIDTVRGAYRSEHVFSILARNGLQYLLPLLVVLSFVTKAKNHYVVVGGWLPETAARSRWICWILKRVDFVYVESEAMKVKMQTFLDLSHISVIPNYRRCERVAWSHLDARNGPVLKILYLSRVSREKGVFVAMDAVTDCSIQMPEIELRFEIWGPIADDDQKEFFRRVSQNEELLKYRGVATGSQCHVIDLMAEYDLFLFPSFYPGEGQSGALIEAQLAGLPIVATNWRYNAEVVRDGENGMIVEPKNIEHMTAALKLMLSDARMRNDYAIASWEGALLYSENRALEIFEANITSEREHLQ